MKRLCMLPPSPRLRRARGFALLEVLIAVLVMAFGMLGIAGLLFATNRSNTSSIMKQQAVQSANDIVDRIRANRAAALAGSYDLNNLSSTTAPVVPDEPAVDCSSANPCTNPSQLAAYDTWYWLAKDLGQLPLGSGQISRGPVINGVQVTVTVQWTDAPATANLGAATSSPTVPAGIAQVVVTTVL